MQQRSSNTSAVYSLPDPGELNRRVEYRKRVDMPGVNSGTEPEDLAKFKAWTKVRQTGAATYQATVQTDNTVTHYLTLRWRPDISSDLEAVLPGIAGLPGEVLRIRRIRDLNSARRFLLLECESLGAAENYSGGVYG